MAWYHLPYVLHPLAGSDWQTFWRMYRENGPYDRRSALSRVAAIASVTVRKPFDLREHARHRDKILSHEFSEPPLFIIGHWRSGTTHLHNLLSKDPRFAYLTFLQTVMPYNYLRPLRNVKRIISAVMPKDREMDQVELSIDTPQEEEMALAAMNDLAFFRCFYFPHRAEEHFRKSVLLEGISDQERQDFAETYDFLLRKLSYANQGKPLLLKNPANTARIPFLREQFPGAKFVHIVRNPLQVYGSACNLWPYMFKSFAWTDWTEFQKSEAIIQFYREMMKAHLEQRKELPSDCLVEVRFDDLVKSPIKTVSSIYDRLGMEFSDAARQNIQDHLDATSHHSAKKHKSDPELEARLRDEWDFAFDHWGY